jgi:hypothetical protein
VAQCTDDSTYRARVGMMEFVRCGVRGERCWRVAEARGFQPYGLDGISRSKDGDVDAHAGVPVLISRSHIKEC